MGKKSNGRSSFSREPHPPLTLNEHGRTLWSAIRDEFEIDDPAGLQVLAQAAHAADRAERLRALIDQQGETCPTKSGGTKAHPLLKEERANRALVLTALRRLGVVDQPVRQVGRPPAGIGWLGPAAIED